MGPTGSGWSGVGWWEMARFGGCGDIGVGFGWVFLRRWMGIGRCRGASRVDRRRYI